jgi:hypothetical protein
MFEWYALLAEQIRLANWLRYARNKKQVAHYWTYSNFSKVAPLEMFKVITIYF